MTEIRACEGTDLRRALWLPPTGSLKILSIGFAQCERDAVAVDVDVIAVFFLPELLDQLEKRLFAVQTRLGCPLVSRASTASAPA
jgi:hypothetical protein